MTNSESETSEYDVFICHATEDKDQFVRPLAGKLQDLGLRVWYDEFTLQPGDSLSRSIDKGLGSCRCGIVVLSEAFFIKGWASYELRGLVTRQVEGQILILPIWHNISKEQVSAFSPPLADLIALKSDQGVSTTAIEIVKVVNPQLYRAYQLREQLTEASRKPPEYISIQELKPSPRYRDKLSNHELIQVHILRELLGDLASLTFEAQYDSFLRDLFVDRELLQWELSSLITFKYRKFTGCSLKVAENVLWLFLLGDRQHLKRLVADETYRREFENETGVDSMLALRIYGDITQHPALGEDQGAGS